MNKNGKNNLINPADLFRILEEKKTSGHDDLDDFEKEAIEGFESLEQVDSAKALYEDTLKQISDRVSESGASKRKGGIIWWSMAAGLALLVGLFVLWFNSEKNIQNQDLALSNQNENVLNEEAKDIKGKPEQTLQQQLNDSLIVPDQKTLADANSNHIYSSNSQKSSGANISNQPTEYTPSQRVYKASDLEEGKDIQKSFTTPKEEKSQISSGVASNGASSLDEKSNSENSRNRKGTDKRSQDNDVMYDQAAAEQNNTNIETDEALKNLEMPTASKKSAEKEMAPAYEAKPKNDSFKERSIGKKSKTKTKSQEPSIAYAKTEEKSHDEGNSYNNISLNKQPDTLPAVSSNTMSQPVTVTGTYGYTSYFEKAKYKKGDEELKKFILQQAKEKYAYAFPAGKYQVSLKISQHGKCQAVSIIAAPASCDKCQSMFENILKEIQWEPATQNGKKINSDLLLNLTF